MSSGRQFTFFLAPADQAIFEAIIRESGNLAFLESQPLSPQAKEVPDSIIKAMGKERIRLLIARRADLSQIEFTPIRSRDDFTYDVNRVPVIEFDRCYATDRFIRAGRLYRVDKYWDASKQQVSKPDAFIEWADRLYKLAKKSLTKVEQGCYAGAEALELRKAGVAFEGLDIEMGSIEG
jgi:hypothetical protein